jgi:hypothetical protein
VSPRLATLAAWALLALAALALELWARLGRARLASLAQALRLARSRRPGQLALLVGWAWLGWHLFAR